MVDHTVLYSFLAFLAFFIFVGLLSVTKRQKSAEDYLLASRSMSPAFVGLSAAASTASGFGFTGIIGFGYAMGLAGAWFIFGIIFGSLVGFAVTSRRFRAFSQRQNAASYTEYLACDKGRMCKRLQFVLGLVSIVAVTLYATAQLAAGSKALHVLFEWDYNAGAIMGAIIVLVYCWAGGIRASIWTDIAQIIVMYVAMVLLMVTALNEIGGLGALYNTLEQIDPQLVTLLPLSNPFGPFLFILGCLSVGISFIGFPHVMVRFMTLKSSKDARKAVWWFEGSYGAFYVTAYIVALCARVLIPESTDFDTELALPTIALDLLPSILLGVILAGIFAGTISTADSLVLSSTASLSRDIFHKYRDSYNFMKFSTLAFTGAALGIALLGSKNVFDLVLFVIAIMGAGFAPLMLVRVFNGPLTEKVALFMVFGGLAAAVYWRLAGYHVHIYDSLPGMVVALLIYGAAQLFQRLKLRKLA